MRAAVVAIALLLVPLATPTLAGPLVGKATIVNGDTLEIAGQRVRLFGIDAPESAQTCTRGGQPYACGRNATFALAYLVGHNWVHCREKGRDRDGRLVAVCTLGGPEGPEINAEMVREGWALADRRRSTAYVGLENEARQAKRGLWAGQFVKPWVWRRERRESPAR